MNLLCEKCGAKLVIEKSTDLHVYVHTNWTGQEFCGAALASTPGNSRVLRTELPGILRSVSVALECSECGKKHALRAERDRVELCTR